MSTMKKLIGIGVIAAAVAMTGWGGAMADGTCKDHYPYQVTHGHDRDGDGIGCDSNPRPPRNQVSSATPKVSSSEYQAQMEARMKAWQEERDRHKAEAEAQAALEDERAAAAAEMVAEQEAREAWLQEHRETFEPSHVTRPPADIKRAVIEYYGWWIKP